jgi:hypothetical protein
MKAKDELFVLVKSMDKNEKGYFRKFSKIHGSRRQGNYLKLFDCLAAMDTYDEAKVREAFKGEKFLAQLGVTKLYLRNLIIKSLRNYISDSDPEIELLNALAEVALLDKRKMYDSALKLINKLKKPSLQREAFLETLFLLRSEYHALTFKRAHHEVVKSAQNRIDSEYECIRQYQNICDYKNLQGLITSGLQIEGMAPGGSTKKIKEYLKHPLLIDEHLAISFHAKCLRLEIVSKVYLKTGDKEKALEMAQQFVALFHDNPAKIKLMPAFYISALSRLVARFTINHKYNEALKYIAEIDALVTDPSVQLSEAQRYENLMSNTIEKLVLYAKAGEFEKGLTTESKLAEFAKNNSMSDEDLATVDYFLAWCKLATGHAEDALKRINRLVNDEYPRGRKDVILCAYGMSVIIHYELGNYSLIKRLLKMLHNYILANDFKEAGWAEFTKKINEITEAKAAENAKEMRKRLHNLQLTIGDYDFIEIAFWRWWIERSSKEK